MTEGTVLGSMLEAQFVASLIRQPALAKAVTLEAGHFLHPRNAALFRALQSITVDLTPLTLLDEAQRLGLVIDVEYLTAIMDLDADIHTIEDFQERASRIKETFLRYDAKRRIGSLLTQFTDPMVPFHDVLAGVNDVILAASRDAAGDDIPTAPQIIRKAHTRQTGASFSSGLRHIDDATTAQGLRKRQCVGIAAAYGGYKTSLVLNVCHNLLLGGQSVAYLALEDDQVAYTEVLTSIHSGVPLWVVEDYHERKTVPSNAAHALAIEASENWLVNDVGDNWRVYDAGTHPLYRWKLIPSLIAADKIQYGTSVVVLDFLQALTTQYDELSLVMQALTRTAQEQDVCIIILNQMSNATLREGSGKDVFGAKGSGDIGAMVHLGFELQHDSETGRIAMTPPLLKEIAATGVPHFLSLSARKDAHGRPMPSELSEIVMRTKKIRRGKKTVSAVLVDPLSGKVVLQYGEPRYTKL